MTDQVEKARDAIIEWARRDTASRREGDRRHLYGLVHDLEAAEARAAGGKGHSPGPDSKFARDFYGKPQ